MAVETSCRQCGRLLQVPDILVGRAIKCPECGATTDATVDGQTATPTGAETGVNPLRSAQTGDAGGPPDDEAVIPELRRDTEPHRGQLVLALGVVSLVCIAVCAPIAIPFGIAAWFMGAKDVRKIKNGDMDPEGESQTNAGRICGMIGVIISILFTLMYVMIYGAMFGFIFYSMRTAPAPGPPPAPKVAPVPNMPAPPVEVEPRD